MLFVVFWSVVGLIQYASSESCHYTRCLGCRPEITYSPGHPVECHPSNWVSPQWVHNYGHPPPATDSRVPIEYRCLKMVATPDDKSFGNTVDVIRGCIPRAQVDSVCMGLKAVESARSHSDVSCFICKGNDCNTATQTQQLKAFVIVISIVVYFIFR